MEEKGKINKNNWLKTSLSDIAWKVEDLTSKIENVSDYCKNCDRRLKDIELKAAMGNGIKIGKADAYHGVDRRNEEKRNRLYVWIAVLTVAFSCLAYAVTAFNAMNKSIENKINNIGNK